MAVPSVQGRSVPGTRTPPQRSTSTSPPRTSAQAAACLSNIRQLGIAHTLYINDNDERFIDAGLAHGGVNAADKVETAWPFALEPYYGASPVLKSPGDRSRFWPTDQGGSSDLLSLASYRALAQDGQQPETAQLARWTSYGLNNFTVRGPKPFIFDFLTGRELGPWDRLGAIPRPFATVHFLLMTEGDLPGSEEFAVTDHVHAEDWGAAGEANAPLKAQLESEIFAFGGEPGSPKARANYGFLDGHARSMAFGDVYTNPEDNKFDPRFAR